MLEMSTLYKTGDGERHRSNCFPVPGFFRHRQEGRLIKVDIIMLSVCEKTPVIMVSLQHKTS